MKTVIERAREALMRMKVYGDTFAYRSNEQTPYEQVCEALEAFEALAEQHEMTNIERHERNVQKFLAEQPAQQEPFGFAVMENPIAPPAQRTWVGLTDEDIDYLCELAYENDEELILTVQAKIKEKNQ